MTTLPNLFSRGDYLLALPMLVLSAFVRRTLTELVQVPGAVSPTFTSSAVGADYSYDRAPACAPRLLVPYTL